MGSSRAARKVAQLGGSHQTDGANSTWRPDGFDSGLTAHASRPAQQDDRDRVRPAPPLGLGGKSLGITTRFEHKFEAIDENSTRILFLAWMSGPMSFLARGIFGRMMHQYLTRALPKLKSEMEASD